MNDNLQEHYQKKKTLNVSFCIVKSLSYAIIRDNMDKHTREAHEFNGKILLDLKNNLNLRSYMCNGGVI